MEKNKLVKPYKQTMINDSSQTITKEKVSKKGS